MFIINATYEASFAFWFIVVVLVDGLPIDILILCGLFCSKNEISPIFWLSNVTFPVFSVVSSESSSLLFVFSSPSPSPSWVSSEELSVVSFSVSVFVSPSVLFDSSSFVLSLLFCEAILLLISSIFLLPSSLSSSCKYMFFLSSVWSDVTVADLILSLFSNSSSVSESLISNSPVVVIIFEISLTCSFSVTSKATVPEVSLNLSI